MARSVSILNFLTGVPGVGKSWRAIWYLINEVIPELGENSKLYTNLPLNIPAFVEHFKDETLSERIVLIDNDEMRLWRESRKSKIEDQMLGPWTYFADRECSGAVFILDEIHELCNKKDPPKYREKWENFLATIRHRGFKFSEFLTQDEMAVATEIKNRAGIKVALEDNESELDGTFKIPLFDWYNLIACYTKKYKKSFLEKTYKKESSRWARKPMKEVRRYIDPEYFKFYDSFNHTSTTEEEGSKDKHEEIKPFEKLGFLKTHFWFFGRNFFSLFSRSAIAVFLVWLLLLGGLQTLMTKGVQSLTALSKPSQSTRQKSTPEKQEKILEYAKELEEEKKANEMVSEVKQDPLPNQHTNEINKLPLQAPEVVVKSPLDDIKIVMITNKYFMTADGLIHRVGDRIGEIQIMVIDYPKRGVLTSEGFITYQR
jgi:hypothetical protein